MIKSSDSTNGDHALARSSTRLTLAVALAKFALARISCSQSLMTLMPSLERRRLTSLPCAIFRAILVSQYGRFCFGIRKQSSQPCQKQPSTNTATDSIGNQKSGIPAICRGWSFHPLMPALTSSMRSFSSVERFPRERTLLICRLRADFERESTPLTLVEHGMGAQ
jgi:hypothetical protein